MRFLQLLKVVLVAFLGSTLLFQSDTSTFTFSCDAPSHPDYVPLMALYNATDGPNWNNNSGWGVDCDVCGWYGVSCTNDRVSFLDLPNNNLGGYIPAEIGNLNILRILRMHRNNISGDIPSTFANLILLEEVQIGNNLFNANFPDEFFDLPLLKDIRLPSAGFFGTIPDRFDEIPELVSFDISNNNITGELPESLYGLSKLGNLSFSNTQITGGFKDLFDGLTSLWNLSGINTPIGGVLPNSLGEASSLRYINLSNCDLNGAIPEALFNIPGLVNLSLPANNLVGGLSSQVGNLSLLIILNLSSNPLGGVIPSEIGNLMNLSQLNLTQCQLNGIIPLEIYNLSNLTNFNLASNNLTGIISPSIGNMENLTSLRLGNNDLNGILPGTIQNLINLRILNLVDNQLSGDLHNLFVGFSELIQLFLSQNEFSGTFPVEIAELPSLQNLNLSNNKLEGCFPSEYISLCTLNTINFDQNCTFQNPRFSEFCSGEQCNNTLDLVSPTIELCQGELITVNSPFSYTSYQWSVLGEDERVLQTPATFSQYYYLTITNSRGCTKSDSIYIKVLSTEPGAEYAEICPGNDVTINGTTYNQIGDFTQVIPRPGACDSTVNITIVEKEGSTGTYTESICPGSTTTINGAEFGPGIASQTIENQAGCDSVISITINEYPKYSEELTFSVCQGETYNYQGQELPPNTYIFPLMSTNGCDSIINLIILEKPSEQTNLTEIICQGQRYQVGNQFFENTDTYVIDLLNQEGCDSTVYLQLTVISGEDQTINASICKGDSYSFAGIEYDENISVQDSVIIEGCKSLTTLNLTVLEPAVYEFDKIACDGSPEFFFGKLLIEDGSYEHNLKSAQNCDSLIIMNLEFAPNIEVTIDTFICDGEKLFFEGQFYAQPGTIEISGTSSSGCDSTTILKIDLYETETISFQELVCEGDSVLLEGVNYAVGNHSGSYFDGNCEVLFELTVTEAENISSNETIVFCSGSSVEFMDNVYNQSGQYYLGEKLSDCEILESLMVLEGSTETQITPQVFCIGTSIELDGEVITSNGVYPHPSESECSGEFLSILFIDGEQVNIEHVLQPGESYILNNTSYQEEGTYEITVGDEYGCPTLIVLTLKIQSCGGARQEEKILCLGESTSFFDHEITESGTYEYLKPLEIGCDSVLTLVVTVIDEVDFDIVGQHFICDGEETILTGPEGYEYLWSTGDSERQISTSEGGQYNLTIFDENNCPSFQSIILEEINFPTEDIDILISDPSTCTASDGEIIVDLSNDEDYVYSIDGGLSFQAGNEFYGLTNDTYEIVLSDQDQRCFKSLNTQVVLESAGVPQIENIDIVQINDCIGQLGRISITPEDQSATYIFSIDDGVNWSASPVFGNLAEGSYTVHMKVEGSDCVNNLSSKIDLENIGILTAEISVLSKVSCDKSSDGEVTIDISEGQAPYQVNWSDGQTGIVAYDLRIGIYEVSITDDNGCVSILPFSLEAPEVSDALGAFQDTILCADEILNYDVDSNYNYVIFKDDILYYDGDEPVISDVGVFQVIAEDGISCISDKYFEISEVDVSDLGIDFLLSTEGVRGIEVVMVNISDPMPADFEWDYELENIESTGSNRFTRGLTFKDTGTYEIVLLTDVDGCLASLEKTIVIYPDSSYLGSYEDPRPPLDVDRFGTWEVFPNPNDGQFDVEIKVGRKRIQLEINIYDIYGAKMESRHLEGSRQYLESFNLANANTGVYTIVLSVLGKQFHKNILIVK